MSIDVSTLKLAELTSTALGSKTTLDEVLKVWYSLGKIINGQLEKKKGIKLPSFGTFSLSTTLQPLFVVSNEFASQYSLKQKNIGNIEKIPTVLLNLSQLAKYASIERDQTEKIYSKFLYTVGRSILEGRSVSITIHRIAEIVIHNNELKCEFISDYITKFPSIFQIANEQITRRTFIKNVAEKTLKPKTDIDAYDAYSLSSPLNIPNSRTMNRRNSSSSMPLTKQSLDQLNQRPNSRNNNNNNNINDPRQIAAKAISNNIKGNSNDTIIDRIRAKIIERGGSNGIRTLSRLLSIMDDNGDKRLSKDELRFGLRDYGIDLSTTELETTFSYFDRDKNGFIDFNEFLIGIRGPLSNRRKQFIRMAFDTLDSDKSGYVTADEILQKYNFDWNPDVKAGKKTVKEAAKDFMTQWDRQDNDGIVSYEEFEDYYKDVSASIDDDTYFELMMRNAWHIAGGEGAAANSSNRRVLVTKADGSQTVETINNDLGLRSKDKDGMKSRLDQQGIKSSNIDLYGFSDNTEKPTVSKLNRNTLTNNRNSQNSSNRNDLNINRGDQNLPPTPQSMIGSRGSQVKPAVRQAWGDQNQSSEPLRTNSRNQSNNNSSNNINLSEKLRLILYSPPIALEQLCNKLQVSLASYNPRISMSAFKTRILALDPKLDKNTASLLWNSIDTNNQGSIEIQQLYETLSNKFGKDKSSKANLSVTDRAKTKILERCGGQAGIKGLTRVLAIMDNNGDKRLTKDELKFGLSDYGIELNIRELDDLFFYFDRDRNGFIDINEFLVGMRGDLNDNRRKFVKLAFDTLDTDKSGYITTDEIAQAYDVSANPDVLSGKKTKEQALHDFMSQWDRIDSDGIVTYEEFEDYYKEVSASIDGDEYFELMMRNAWHIAGGEGAAANSSNRRVLVTKADGSQSVETINNDLGLRSKDKDGMKSRLDQQGIKSSNIDLYGFSDNTDKPSNNRSRLNLDAKSSQRKDSKDKLTNRRSNGRL